MLQTRLPLGGPSNDLEAETPSLQRSISAAKGVLVRQYPIMLFIVAIFVGAAALYVLTAPRKYTSTASLIIDSRKVNMLQQQNSAPDMPIEAAMIDSQVEILKSETIALAVIKDLRLADDPEFSQPGGGLIGGFFSLLSELIPSQPLSDYQVQRVVLWELQRHLTVKRVGLSYVIELTYQSLSPQRAAQIANAIAEAYIVDSLESKYQSSRRAAVWLQDRLKELRAQASAAERAVVDFKAKNNIVDAGGRSLTDQQLAEVNSAVTVARAQRAEAEARFSRISRILDGDAKAGGDGAPLIDSLATVTDTLNNAVIIKLRQNYLDIAARESDWANRFGSGHLAVVNLRNQMREIRRSITDELRRIAESYKSELEIARAREASGEKSLSATIALSNDSGQAQIVLRDLESNAQSTRALADNFLQLYMVSVQQQSFPITEARVITPAAVIFNPSSPKTLLILLGAIIGGSIFAGLIAFLREAMDRVFRSGPQVETVLGVGCLATLPILGAGKTTIAKDQSHGGWRKLLKGKAAAHAQRPAAKTPLSTVSAAKVALSNEPRQLSVRNVSWTELLESPFSRFSESIRSIKIATDLGHLETGAKVVGMTSSLPNEGKSTISSALALASSQGGYRVLLVDGDIRNPALTRSLSPQAGVGLVEVVLGKTQFKDAIWTEPQSGLHFLPCVATQHLSNSADLLASSQIENLFRGLRDQYDRIIVDLSPLAPVIDVRGTGRLIDSYIMVIEWSRTHIDVVERSIAETPVLRQKLLGAVLNKVDHAIMNRYDLFRGNYYYNRYYQRYGYVD